MSELSYTNKNGQQVFTSQYHRNRGTCCKNNCLHCPYGTTLDRLGLVCEEVPFNAISEAQGILSQYKTEGNVANLLLAQAFNDKPKNKEISTENLHEYRLVKIKDQLCGVIEVDGNKVKDVFLDKYFKDQGITEDIISYYYQK